MKYFLSVFEFPFPIYVYMKFRQPQNCPSGRSLRVKIRANRDEIFFSLELRELEQKKISK